MTQPRSQLVEHAPGSLRIHERRVALLNQLLLTGPEHFDQRAWFKDNIKYYAELPDIGQQGNIDKIKCFDPHSCGAAACLAGHGALLMVNDPTVTVTLRYITADDVSQYFQIDTDWFMSEISEMDNHPWSSDDWELQREANRNDTPLTDWQAQVDALTQLIVNTRREVFFENLDGANDY